MKYSNATRIVLWNFIFSSGVIPNDNLPVKLSFIHKMQLTFVVNTLKGF